jgi:hypothetical protein
MHFEIECGKKAFDFRVQDFFNSAGTRNAGLSLKALPTWLNNQPVSAGRDLLLAVRSLDRDSN